MQPHGVRKITDSGACPTVRRALKGDSWVNLPYRPYMILWHVLITCNQRHIFDFRLCNEHPIEWIAMDKRKCGNHFNVFWMNVENRICSLYIMFNKLIDTGENNVKLIDAVFNGYFP